MSRANSPVKRHRAVRGKWPYDTKCQLCGKNVNDSWVHKPWWRFR